MDNNDKIQIFKPFGPPIGKFEVGNDILEKINSYVDDLTKDENKASKLDAGGSLAGQVNQEINFEKKFSEEFIIPTLIKAIKIYIFANTQKKLSKYTFENIWVVRQFENEYNPVHYHSSHISGVGYLKVPENLGETSQKSKLQNPNGKLEFIHGTKMFLSESNVKITPKVGDFYLFPHYMMHNVYPFKGKGERRSMSFNVSIDENIFDVFSGK
tara:strand:+ start:174 stop:812 length:639 start_codon:yes stop_codon:yes gene_type:complete